MLKIILTGVFAICAAAMNGTGEGFLAPQSAAVRNTRPARSLRAEHKETSTFPFVIIPTCKP